MKRYIKQHKFLLFLVLTIATCRAGFEILLSFAMGDMTNAAVDREIETLLQASVKCVVALIAIYVVYILENYFRKRLTGLCLCSMKADVYNALSTHGIMNFHEKSNSYYLNLLQGDIDLLERDYFDALWRALNLSIQTFFCMIALAMVNWKLFIAFVIVSIVPQIVSRLFRKALIRSKDSFSHQNAVCVQKMKEFIDGFDTILFFAKQKLFISRLMKEDLNLEKKRCKRDVCNIVASYGATTVNMIASIICMAMAAYFVASGEIRFGGLTTSTQLLNYIFTPLNTVINCIISIFSTSGIRKKFINLISEPVIYGGTIFHNGDICFNHVTAGYKSKDVLKDVCCRLEQGKKYAVIGRSGCGKSTFARALMRGANIKKGNIVIGGVDIQELSMDELYCNVLYVPQSTYLFEGTVLDNIGFFVSGDKSRECGIQAELSENILFAQAGGDCGKTLSGGERTRISVARALSSSAPIIIFDEPTTGLDPKTSAEIEKLILNISNKTIIVITHNWNSAYLEQFDGIIEL